ncbi:hypothetical protein [Caulobacter sp. LARHSG274]
MTASTAALLEDALRQIAGPGAAAASLIVDYGPAEALAAQDCGVKAWVERATRSLVFAQAEARSADGALVAAASAVFRKVSVP